MSKSAFSAKVFAIYLFVVGAVLVVAPNFLLSIFRIPPTSEVWIHVVGVTAFMIGVYAWVAAKHEDKPFLEASVYTRFVVFVAFATFAVIGHRGDVQHQASPAVARPSCQTLGLQARGPMVATVIANFMHSNE